MSAVRCADKNKTNVNHVQSPITTGINIWGISEVMKIYLSIECRETLVNNALCPFHPPV
jgi:hypothetical protein